MNCSTSCTMCEEDAEAEEEISVIREAYTEKMLDATGYMQSYAQAENSMKVTMDSAIIAIQYLRRNRRLLLELDLTSIRFILRLGRSYAKMGVSFV